MMSVFATLGQQAGAEAAGPRDPFAPGASAGGGEHGGSPGEGGPPSGGADGGASESAGAAPSSLWAGSSNAYGKVFRDRSKDEARKRVALLGAGLLLALALLAWFVSRQVAGPAAAAADARAAPTESAELRAWRTRRATLVLSAQDQVQCRSTCADSAGFCELDTW